MPEYQPRPYSEYQRLPEEYMLSRSKTFFYEMNRRRSIRDFSNEAIPQSVINYCLKAAGSAPSGANLQPWHFVVVTDQEVKRRIRQAAEREEQVFYSRRAPKEWLEALAPLGTDEKKPFIEIAPYLIAIFAQTYGKLSGGGRIKHYYVQESVGIATGILITALHYAGLATLTHTPSPMNFLNDILGRPQNERPFLLLIVGYPSDNATVPNLHRKHPDEFMTFI